MEVSSVVTSVIGSLCSANSKNPFNNIKYRGGQEREINEIVNVLKKVLNDKGLMKGDCLNLEKSKEFREITFFLILNTEFTALKNLANSDDLGHLVWSTPEISTCLLINIIWELKLNDYLYEAIQFSSFELSSELLLAASKNIKHLSPENSVVIATKLISSTYQNIVYLFNDAYKYSNFSSKLNKTLEIISGLLKYYTDPPNKDKLTNQSTLKLYQHLGKAFLHFFTILCICFRSYIERPSTPVNPNTEIYLTTFCNDKENIATIITDLENFFTKLNIQILDVLKANVMSINVDIYCSWCEFNDEHDRSKTLQRVVGEAAYELLNILKSDSRFEHDVVTVLPAISIQPMNINDRIAEADKETLLENCDSNSPERIKWIHAVLYKESFLLDEEFIDCAVKNCKLIEKTDLKYLITNGISALCGDVKYEHKTKIKSMILTMLFLLPFDEQVLLISDIKIGDELEMDDFNEKLAEFCNKLVSLEDDSISNLFNLFVQNPKKLINNVISMALGSDKQLMLVQQIFEVLSKQNEKEIEITDENATNKNKSYISEMIFNDILQFKIDENTTNTTRCFYTKLIIELCKKHFLNNETILKFVMDHISEYLSSSNSVLLLMYLKIFEGIYNYDTHPKYAAPIIVMIAQIMEAFRWYQGNFEANSEYLISWCTDYVKGNIENLFSTVKTNDNKRMWLLENLAFLTPLNAYYFQTALCKPTHIKLIDCTLEKKELDNCLFYLVPRINYTEFTIIYNELKTEKGIFQAFNILCDTIQKVSLEAENLKSSEAFNCLKNCVQFLALTFTHHIFQDIEGKHIEYLKKILEFIRLLHLHVQQNAFKNFTPAISNIVTKTLKDETVSLEELTKYEELIFDSESKEIFRNLYSKQQ